MNKRTAPRRAKAMSTKQILKKARALIKKHGWVQEEYGNGSDGFCAAGAIMAAIDSPHGFSTAATEEAYFVLEKAIGRPAKGCGLLVWNDRVRRTKEQVLAAFDKAIASL